MYYKISISKTIFAMAGEDPEKLFETSEETELTGIPETASIKRFSTDYEVCAEFSFAISPKTKDEKERAFLPKTKGNKCYIPFLFGNEELNHSDSMNNDDEESNAIAKAMLSSAKCRVLLNKQAFPHVTSAFFEGTEEQDYSIPLFDYGDSYCLEIPFIVLTEQDMYNFEQIVIIQSY